MNCGQCGGSLRKDNTSGFCNRTPQCISARKRGHAVELPEQQGKCLSCGQPLRSDNAVGVCRRPGCQTTYMAVRRLVNPRLLWQRNAILSNSFSGRGTIVQDLI